MAATNVQSALRRLPQDCGRFVFAMATLLGIAATGTADTYGPEFRPGPFTPADFQPVRDMDASGLDLSGAEFLGLDLAGADFSECNLSGAKFLQVKFGQAGASFRSTNLTDVLFEEPDVSRCDFADATINGLAYHPFSNITFLSVPQIQSTRSYRLRDLSRCLLFAPHTPGKAPREPLQLQLDHFDLSECTFAGCDLREASFAKADITGVRFYDVEIDLSQLDQSLIDHPVHQSTRQVGETIRNGTRIQPRMLPGIAFLHMSLKGESLINADLRGSMFRNVDVSNVRLNGALIQGCVTNRAFTAEQIISTESYREGDLSGIRFSAFGLDITKLDLVGQNLSHTVWEGFHFDNVDLTDAVITGADFRPSRRYPPSVAQLQSTWNFQHGQTRGIELPEGHPLQSITRGTR